MSNIRKPCKNNELRLLFGGTVFGVCALPIFSAQLLGATWDTSTMKGLGLRLPIKQSLGTAKTITIALFAHYRGHLG